MASILVVDDEPQILRAMRRFLEREGHEVFDAELGHDALSVLSGVGFDVLVTDLSLPDMSGWDLVRLARAKGFAGAVIVASGHAAEVPKDLERAIKLVLDKPFDFARLLGAIEEVTRPTLPPTSAA